MKDGNLKKSVKLLCLILALTFFSTNATISAHNDPSHIHSGGYYKSQVSNLRYYISPYVDSYGYTYRVEQSLKKMTGVSSNTGLDGEYVSPNMEIDVLAGRYTNSTWTGLASYYAKTSSGFQPVSKTSHRDHTRIQLNKYTMEEVHNYSYNNIYKTALHEVGHALSLAHVTSGDSVMRQGKLSYTSPQTIDKGHLRNKWGY